VCTKAEVKEVVEDALKGVVASQGHMMALITEIKGSMGALPCNNYNEKIIELQFQHKETEKEIDALEKARDGLFKMARTSEKDIATLTEQNINQKEISAKTWAMIMVFITVAFNILGWYLKG